MQIKRKILAIGISVATVATIGVASTLAANAATEYRFTVAEGTDYRAWANAYCTAESGPLETFRTEPAGPGQVTLIFTCQAR